MNISSRSGCVVKMMNLLIVTVLLSYTCSCFKHKQENECAEFGGECVSIEKCDFLKELIHKSPKDRDIVTKHKCGFDGFVSRVCCPQREYCQTLEGLLGTCVTIDECPYLLELKKSIKKDDRKYLRSSRCTTRKRFCCDLTADVKQNSTKVKKTDKDPQKSYITSCSSENPTGLISVEKLLNNDTCCGIEDSNINKIIGGEVTAIDEYPWLVMLEYQTNRDFQCGGSLISSLYVLTAAHCLVEKNHSRGVNAVRLGEYNTTHEGKDCIEVAGGGEDCTDGAVTITINKTIVHPDFQSDYLNIKYANDIGLLRLSEPAPYTAFIRPICLPSSDVTKVATSDLRFQTAGWGTVSDIKKTSDVKLQVALPMLEQKMCEQQFLLAGRSLLWHKQLCAGGELDKDTCKGDSGGPLTYSHDNKKHQIVGINSFGFVKCGIEGRSSVFTKVIEYIPWIEDNTKD